MLLSRISCLVLAVSLACGDDGGALDGGALDGGRDGGLTDGAGADGGEDLDSGLDAAADAGDPDVGVDSGPPGPPCAEALDLYADSSCETLRPGILRYAPRFWLWSDGTGKDRFIRFPEGAVIDTSDADRWIFPVGTKVWKTFSLDGMRLETRVMEKTASGAGWLNWQFRTYRWNEAQDVVTEVSDGVTDVLGTGHDIPPQARCAECHGMTGGGGSDAVLGFGTVQLAHDDTETDLARLDDLGFLSEAVPRSVGAVPGDATTVAALGYLHANCGNCHTATSFVGGGESGPIRLWLPAGLATAEASPAYQTTVRIPSGWRDLDGEPLMRIAPGDPENSAVIRRMAIREPGRQMPPLATEVVHAEGVAAIERWIREGAFPE